MKKSICFSAVSAVFLAGCATIGTTEQKTPLTDENVQNAAVFAQAMAVIHKNYVDPQKVTEKQLFNAAISGMASGLDPYSAYESPDNFKNQQEKRIGELCGIGITMVKPKGKYLYVLNVIPNSPAEKANIPIGSNIVSVNGKDLKNLNLQQCRNLISGPAGSKVELKLIHAGKHFSKTLVRKKIIMPTITAAKMLQSGIGFIKIDSFTPHTPEEFSRAMMRLKKADMRALIIDLRNNSGGHVNATVQTLSQLLEPGKVILTAHRRDHSKTETLYSKKYKLIQPDTRTPLILLVNNLTASSAEIFSGALKDHARAELAGTRTFGKGTLLHVVKLLNGGALRIATGRYRTPSGKVIEGTGIEPDHRITLPALTVQQLIHQSRKYPGIVKPAEKNTIEDTQLKFALERLSKISNLTENHETGSL